MRNRSFGLCSREGELGRAHSLGRGLEFLFQFDCHPPCPPHWGKAQVPSHLLPRMTCHTHTLLVLVLQERLGLNPRAPESACQQYLPPVARPSRGDRPRRMCRQRRPCSTAHLGACSTAHTTPRTPNPTRNHHVGLAARHAGPESSPKAWPKLRLEHLCDGQGPRPGRNGQNGKERKGPPGQRVAPHTACAPPASLLGGKGWGGCGCGVHSSRTLTLS